MKNINKTINTKGHFEKIGILTPKVLKLWRVLEKLKQQSDEKTETNRRGV
jgi:hypothetical protein